MDLSIVTTLYHSARSLEEFCRRVGRAARQITSNYEIVLVDDGSPDDSLEIALSIHALDERVKVIELSRNFGHHKALLAGMARARGDMIFIIDSDLEVPPEVLPEMYHELARTDADTVYGVQAARKGGLWEKISGDLFYRLFNRLSHCPVSPNIAGVRLMRRNFCDSLLEHKDRGVYLAGLCAVTGYRQVPMTVPKEAKERTTYTFSRKMDLLLNAITSFSEKPLVLIFYLGLLFTFLSGTALVVMVAGRVFFHVPISGLLYLAVSLWFLGALIILCVGIVGIYVSKVLIETKDRPLTIVRRTYDRSNSGAAGRSPAQGDRDESQQKASNGSR
ncbi:MAG: glycosyltransferase family 2 protein [Desulfomonilaceae bacterium]|nr:glycosyltransferase family 2 protein [Desulfomonilaceae bacterium]